MNYRFMFPSGRTIVVAVARGEIAAADATLLFRASVNAGDPVNAAEDASTGRTVNLTGLAAAGMALLAAHWRLWGILSPPNTATNLNAPAGLQVGDDKIIDNVRWIGGQGPPPQSLVADLGACYADLAAGTIYRRVRALAEKMAEQHAQLYDALLTARAQLAELPAEII